MSFEGPFPGHVSIRQGAGERLHRWLLIGRTDRSNSAGGLYVPLQVAGAEPLAPDESNRGICSHSSPGPNPRRTVRRLRTSDFRSGGLDGHSDDVSEATGWNESTGVVPRKEVSDRMVLNENGSVGALRRLCFGAFVGTLGRWAVATSCATSHVAIANDDGQRSRLVPK